MLAANTVRPDSSRLSKCETRSQHCICVEIHLLNLNLINLRTISLEKIFSHLNVPVWGGAYANQLDLITLHCARNCASFSWQELSALWNASQWFTAWMIWICPESPGKGVRSQSRALEFFFFFILCLFTYSFTLIKTKSTLPAKWNVWSVPGLSRPSISI